jgi:hypothetical protein
MSGAGKQSTGALQAMASEYTDGVFHGQAIWYWLKRQMLWKKSKFKKLCVTDASVWLDTDAAASETAYGCLNA